MLQNPDKLFNETLGTWKIDLVDFKLKQNVKPICSIPYPVPKVHEKNCNKVVELLVLLGVRENSNDSEWGAPYFAQIKPKTNRASFLSGFIKFKK